MPPPSFVFGYVPDSPTTFNFPFKDALRLLAMKRNLLISAYYKNEDPPGIILLQVGSQPTLVIEVLLCYIFCFECDSMLLPKKSEVVLTSLPRGIFEFYAST